ncbi:hypothetical protein PHYBOEH_000246 [Phytophthora boehmeriae]|uniref:Necrosis inducing-like protein NPP1 type n=1 Tax=Phytophthora boehmeriae TaxID=109152 RepID=A0A8T1VEU1_9STRA|nr:hypothetical protein PHYBOEH_000246 [Phytophthora boehmeriae]
MNFRALSVVIAAAAFAASADTIDHDKVKPIPEPEPSTVSEKAAVKLKPVFIIEDGCDTYAAVNAEGKTNGGLKPSWGTSGCKTSVLGSQVYGRAAWYNDKWAIMYAWYFPKGFWGHFATRRHDWAHVVMWIDNPDSECPKVQALSLLNDEDSYTKEIPAPDYITAGFTPIFYHALAYVGEPFIHYTRTGNERDQDLIMWDQLPDAARVALNTTDFGKAKVPFIDEHFTKTLEKAWPWPM